jgi:hypothetical protein
VAALKYHWEWKMVDELPALIHLNADDYSSPAPSDGSSAASIFESRFMLIA